MEETLNALDFERGKLRDQMKVLTDRADLEKRSFNQEEENQFNALYKDFSEKTQKIKELRSADIKGKDREARMAEVEKELATASAGELRALGLTPRPIDVSKLTALKVGEEAGKREERSDEEKEKEYRSLFNRYLLGDLAEHETRTLQQGDPSQGGFFVAPMRMGSELLADLTNETMIRQYARVLPPLKKAVSLGVLKLVTRMGAAAWSGELYNAPEDASIRTGRRLFYPNPKSAFTKIGTDFLRNSMIDPDAFVREEIARVMGELEEQGYISGDGDKKPLGLLTAHADGITTARHISTGNSTTDIEFDGLIEAKFALKPQYRKSKSMIWFVHPDFVKRALKKKDGNGQYIWQQNVKAGEPDMIFGYPVVESMYMPNTFTTGQLVGVLGDFRWYWIVDVVTLEIQVLKELYALTNEIGYLARGFTDGQPAKEEAFSIVKLA